MQCSPLSCTFYFIAIAFVHKLTIGTVISEGVTQHGITSGCILPHQPTGGTYNLVTCTGSPCIDMPGSRVPSGSFISYRCNDGYVLMGTDNLSSCFINTWHRPPTCIKACQALRSASVDITCTYQGAIVSCEFPIAPGTKATLACKDFYNVPFARDPVYREVTCREDGTWNRAVFDCIPECGTAVAQGRTMVFNGFRATYPGYPWHVGVYKKRATVNFEQICGGTLISSNLVVSAAHCFWDETFRTVENATGYVVAAGKYYRDYNISSLVEPYAQKSQVKEIKLAERFFGYSGNYAHDIALLRLETPFVLSTLVKPICMNWDNLQEVHQLRSGTQGKAVGWGKTAAGVSSVPLQEINLPYVPYRNCLNVVPEDFKGMVTPDKFCAGHTNGSSLCEGDSGGGFFFRFGGLWFLRGVVSVSPKANDSCDNNYYTAFTDVTQFREWIRNAYLSPSFVGDNNPVIIHATTVMPIVTPAITISTSGCILPEQPAHGSFELGSCEKECIVQSGTRVPFGSFLIYRCNTGYTVDGNIVAICRDNTWIPAPTCIRKRPGRNCPALESKTVDVNCTYYGEIVSCDSPIASWTKATLACKNFYNIPPAHDPVYREIICLENGMWDRDVFQCIPDCQKAVIGSQITWDVGIFHKQSTGSFLYTCNGTLVSSGLVITVTGWHQRDKEKFTNANNLAVTTSKSHIFDDTLEPHAQKSMVRRIDLAIGRHEWNGVFRIVALLRLHSPFTITPNVSPICLDWYKDIGVTTPRKIPYEDCLSYAPPDKKKYVTADTFCENHCTRDDPHWRFNQLSFEYTSDGVWYLLGYMTNYFTPQNVACFRVNVYASIRHNQDWIWGAYTNTG